MDEIAWVLDTNQCVQWKAGNGDFFRVVSGEKSWDNPKFRIVDQPFLEKAIFGWYLDNNNLLHTWSESKSKELYSLFVCIFLAGYSLWAMNFKFGLQESKQKQLK